ncbi:DUF3301 domain-containing protein [Saccharospirillum impatiens]|uniref:DUF3301 domain-containing protein n=1 Tax=Saccharospirillum impatiens TaxID=169438 RepID=UPI0003FB74D0|nr:DUF3301 domain-containing protein [Saccharospirillum impatiens]
MDGKSLLILLFVIIAGAWIWHHLGLRQIALFHARRSAKKEGVQMLDDSIYLHRMRLARSTDTLFAFQRMYQFEFSTVGDRRFLGWVILRGRRLESVHWQPYVEDKVLH